LRIYRIASDRDLDELIRTARSTEGFEDIITRISRIVEDVRIRGDEAVIEYTERLDGVKLSRGELYISSDNLRGFIEKVDRDLIDSLGGLARRVKDVESPIAELVRKPTRVRTGYGVEVENIFEPIERVACYIPGGLAPYISTAIMCGVTARMAGVRRLVALLPPKALTGAMAAAIAIAGFDGVYRIGGPHGIAALAYGTESIERVDKIAGPGGIYVTAAKAIVSRIVGIDMLAGPTELLIYIDLEGLEDSVSWHLAAQAEHGDSVMLLVVTPRGDIAESLARYIERLSGDKKGRLFERVSRLLGIAITDTPERAFELINRMAPEHVEICSRSKEAVENIRNYGVLIDGCASTAINDYYSGANHILPTMSWARWRGGLSILDFVVLRRRVYYRGSHDDLRRITESVRAIAMAEGFTAHPESIYRGGVIDG